MNIFQYWLKNALYFHMYSEYKWMKYSAFFIIKGQICYMVCVLSHLLRKLVDMCAKYDEVLETTTLWHVAWICWPLLRLTLVLLSLGKLRHNMGHFSSRIRANFPHKSYTPLLCQMGRTTQNTFNYCFAITIAHPNLLVLLLIFHDMDYLSTICRTIYQG